MFRTRRGLIVPYLAYIFETADICPLGFRKRWAAFRDHVADAHLVSRIARNPGVIRKLPVSLTLADYAFLMRLVDGWRLRTEDEKRAIAACRVTRRRISRRAKLRRHYWLKFRVAALSPGPRTVTAVIHPC
jgi:hypothetical protein